MCGLERSRPVASAHEVSESLSKEGASSGLQPHGKRSGFARSRPVTSGLERA